jgi:hypothetical protein
VVNKKRIRGKFLDNWKKNKEYMNMVLNFMRSGIKIKRWKKKLKLRIILKRD